MPLSAIGRTTQALAQTAQASRDTAYGLGRYSREFWNAFLSSSAYFNGLEWARMPFRPPMENILAYAKLAETNLELIRRTLLAIAEAAGAHGRAEGERAYDGWLSTWLGGEGETIDEVAARQARLARALIADYPAAIRAVAEEFGFHFEKGQEPLVAETDRFLLYRVLPNDPKVKVDEARKPLIIVPPYVLGSNILAFLPKKGRSYAHAFANQGVPTYIRIMKDIAVTEAVQVMTGEDDVRDTRHFCEKVKAAHGRPVTLNGYCQGGYSALVNLLSGELDGLVDALLTCVSPMDGTKSPGLAGFLGGLPQEFNHLDYGTKTLRNGNRVADGHLMGWVYKLKSIETENPVNAYYRDLAMMSHASKTGKISTSAAAINYWLREERNDLPLAVTKMSFASYRTPIAEDGTLPVTLFGRELNLKRITEKSIPWLICYGERDDLVEKECALAPTEHVEAEVTEFPRGHVAIATSWSNPESAYGLHKVYPDGSRGPVRFQLDLETEGRPAAKKRRAEAPRRPTAAKPSNKKPTPKKLVTRKASAKNKLAAKKTTKATKATAKKPTSRKLAAKKPVTRRTRARKPR
jgi:hypothetical protein